jgi:predicted transcriptional regulator
LQDGDPYPDPEKTAGRILKKGKNCYTPNAKYLFNTMKTLDIPESLKASLDQYSKAVHQEPEEVIVEAVTQFLTVRAAQREGIEEALLVDDEEGVHFTHETIGKWIQDLEQGRRVPPTPDA